MENRLALSSQTKAEIDLNAIAHNVSELRKITSPESRLMAVVKANAYGHGDLEVSRAALSSGADTLGVARLAEAVRLRDAGIGAPILILGYTPHEFTKELIDMDLAQTVFSAGDASLYSEAASREGQKLKVHIKIDIGMGRLGFLNEGLVRQMPRDVWGKSIIRSLDSMARLPGLDFEGISAHFPCADMEDRSMTINQLDAFVVLIDQVRKSIGLEFRVRHAANSAAAISLPETHLDMVRIGIAIYGLSPAPGFDKRQIRLKPAMELKSRIIQIKKVPKGFKVSYGGTFSAENNTRIATVPIGYADGLSRLLSSRGSMLVRGRRAKIAGRICMDLTMLDIGQISDARVGDEVVIFGKQKEKRIEVDELAEKTNTINYEIVSTITNRVPRVYFS